MSSSGLVFCINSYSMRRAPYPDDLLVTILHRPISWCSIIVLRWLNLFIIDIPVRVLNLLMAFQAELCFIVFPGSMTFFYFITILCFTKGLCVVFVLFQNHLWCPSMSQSIHWKGTLSKTNHTWSSADGSGIHRIQNIHTIYSMKLIIETQNLKSDKFQENYNCRKKCNHRKSLVLQISQSSVFFVDLQDLFFSYNSVGNYKQMKQTSRYH